MKRCPDLGSGTAVLRGEREMLIFFPTLGVPLSCFVICTFLSSAIKLLLLGQGFGDFTGEVVVSGSSFFRCCLSSVACLSSRCALWPP